MKKKLVQGFLSLVKTMASDHVRVLFTIPSCETMEFLVKEWSLGAFSESLLPLGMVRAVNVESVLRKAAYRGTGKLILGIKDAVIPENNGNYWIRFTNGALTALERVDKEQPPQISMDISDFSHGIFRGFLPGEIINYDSVEILDQKVMQNGVLEQIFYSKKNFIMEYF